MTDTTTSAPAPAYNASGNGRRLRAWRPPNIGPNLGGTIDQVVTRARDLVRNNPWAGAAVDRYVSNMVATGIQAKTVNGTPEERAAVDALWRKSCKQMDADGVLIFEAQQALAAHEWKEAGEVFARIRSRRPGDGLVLALGASPASLAEEIPPRGRGDEDLRPGIGDDAAVGNLLVNAKLCEVSRGFDGVMLCV